MSIDSGQIIWNTGANCDRTFTLLTGIINCYHFKSRSSKLRCSNCKENILNKVKKSEKIRQQQKTLISTLA